MKQPIYVTTQFQAFTHPESSHSILAQEAEELFGRHDADGDGTISEAEYLKDPFVEFDEDELQDRRRTFRQGLDADKVNMHDLYQDISKNSQGKQSWFKTCFNIGSMVADEYVICFRI